MRDLSLHLLDILMNSISADASEIALSIDLDTIINAYVISVTDNGIGLPLGNSQDAMDPYYTTKHSRKVGLGLSLFREACVKTGGTMSIDPASPNGVCVRACMLQTSVDSIPLGDIAQTMAGLIFTNPSITFSATFCRDHVQEARFNSCDVRLKFGQDVSNANTDVYLYIYDTISNQVQMIFGGSKNEITFRT